MTSWPVRILLCWALLAAGSPTLGAQRQTQRSDLEKELRIMEGILKSTISFALEEVSDPSWSSETSSRSFYLPEQGAVFLITLRGPNPVFAVAAEGLSFSSSGQFSGVMVGTEGKSEEVRKQQKARQEAAAKEEEQWQQRLEKAKAELVEALALHGASLKELKEQEWINVVLLRDGITVLWPSDYGSSRAKGTTREILSVPMSAVRAYQKGLLSLEEFRQKVLRRQE